LSFGKRKQRHLVPIDLRKLKLGLKDPLVEALCTRHARDGNLEVANGVHVRGQEGAVGCAGKSFGSDAAAQCEGTKVRSDSAVALEPMVGLFI
jgi:hypothetical protein